MATTTAGIDLGGTKCLGVVMTGDVVTAEVRAPTPRVGGGEAVLDTIARVVEELGAGAGKPLSAVGVGAPGLVDRRGVLRFAPNLPGATGLDVAGGLGRRLGMPVFVDNDATCATWGEATTGAGRGISDLVMVTLGTGIGGGIVLHGRLWRGTNGYAGEVGHIIVDPNGIPCPCGQRGCWERYASGSGLGRLGREAAIAGRAGQVVELAGGDPEAVRGEHVTAAAREGDAGALEVMAEFVRWMAVGLVSLANIFDPQAFVIGGGLVDAGALLFGPAQEAFDELFSSGPYRPPIKLLPAALGEQAGAVGAARLGEADR